MTHSYASQYPTDLKVDDGIKAFFEDFYRISDTPDAHDTYADQFVEGATLFMGIQKAVGREEILTIRKGLWTAVSSRQHTIIKIFPFGSGSNELMLYGTVAYTLKDGKKADVDWSARANLVKEDGKWKFEFYQVYLDSAAKQLAK